MTVGNELTVVSLAGIRLALTCHQHINNSSSFGLSRYFDPCRILYFGELAVISSNALYKLCSHSSNITFVFIHNSINKIAINVFKFLSRNIIYFYSNLEPLNTNSRFIYKLIVMSPFHVWFNLDIFQLDSISTILFPSIFLYHHPSPC